MPASRCWKLPAAARPPSLIVLLPPVTFIFSKTITDAPPTCFNSGGKHRQPAADNDHVNMLVPFYR